MILNNNKVMKITKVMKNQIIITEITILNHYIIPFNPLIF